MVAVLRKVMNASTGKNEKPPERPPLVEFLPPDVQEVSNSKNNLGMFSLNTQKHHSTYNISFTLFTLQEIAAMPPRRLLGTHLHPDKMPASFFTKKPKVSNNQCTLNHITEVT